MCREEGGGGKGQREEDRGGEENAGRGPKRRIVQVEELNIKKKSVRESAERREESAGRRGKYREGEGKRVQ